jgi:hypothetical protein
VTVLNPELTDLLVRLEQSDATKWQALRELGVDGSATCLLLLAVGRAPRSGALAGMAAGLPIITTARGGNPEVMSGTECGIVVGAGGAALRHGCGTGDAAVEPAPAGTGRVSGAETGKVQVQLATGGPGVSQVWASEGK